MNKVVLKNNKTRDLPSLFDDFFLGWDGMFPVTKTFKDMLKSIDYPVYPLETYPKCDVREYDDHYEIDSTVPGLNKDDIKVYIKNDCLYIECNKCENSENKEFKYHCQEIKKSKSLQSFYLNENCEKDITKYNTVLKNGILSIVIPKINVKEPIQNEVQYIPINEL